MGCLLQQKLVSPLICRLHGNVIKKLPLAFGFSVRSKRTLHNFYAGCKKEDVDETEDVNYQRKQPNKMSKRVKPTVAFLEAFDRVVGFLRPRRKGDARDVLLMSLSFAVYVYISQKLVSAYCFWQGMPMR